MAFEEGIDLALIVGIALAVIIVMISFFLFFRPHVEGGWFTSIAAALKWLALPPV